MVQCRNRFQKMKLLLQICLLGMCFALSVATETTCTSRESCTDKMQNLFDNSFIENILREYDHSPTLRICDIFVESAANPGDIYLSDLYRVHADGFKNGENCVSPRKEWSYDYTKHLIVKIPREHDLDSHEFEMYVYEHAIPELEKYLPSNTSFAFSKLVHGCTITRKMTILEDWADSDYSRLDRRRPYSPKTMEAALTELAKLHAASIIMKQNAASTFDEITSHLRDRFIVKSKQDKYLEHFTNSFQMAKLRSADPNFVSNSLPEEVEQSKTIFRMDTSEIFQKAITALKEVPEDLQVIAHADFWQNNVMEIKTNPGNIKIVDLGNLCKSNLVRDLIYIFATSPMKIEERSTVVENYLQKFKFFLRQGYVSETTIEKYTTELLMNEIKRLKNFEFVVATIFAMPTQFTLVPSEDEINKLPSEAARNVLSKYLGNGFDLRVRYINSVFY